MFTIRPGAQAAATLATHFGGWWALHAPRATRAPGFLGVLRAGRGGEGARDRRLRGLGRELGWAGATLAGAAAVLVGLAGGPAPIAQEEPKLAWVDVQKPFALYDVNLPAFRALDRAYEARRHAEGGGRRDRLAFGRIGETPYLRFEVYRVGDEPAPRVSLHVAAARRAAEIGYSIDRSGAVAGRDSRFGLVEIADVTLARLDQRQHCLVFQTADEGVVRLSGLSCDAGGVAPARQALLCQIDRIQLMAAGDDDRLRETFVAADRRAGAQCGPDRMAGVEPSLRAAQSLEKQPPKLRGAGFGEPTGSIPHPSKSPSR